MLTKNDMARVIIQAINNEIELPATDNVNVKRMATKSKQTLIELHGQSVSVIQQRIDNA